MRYNLEEVDDSLLANPHEATLSACTEHKHISDTNVQVSAGKHCSCVQLIKTCNFYYEYHPAVSLKLDESRETILTSWTASVVLQTTTSPFCLHKTYVYPKCNVQC